MSERGRVVRRSRRVLVATVALTVLPVLVDLLAGGTRRLFSYTAADAFYYLVVARNWARHGFPSFDGHHATNGFHPLWGLLETALTGLGNLLHLGSHGVLWLVILVQLAMVAVTVALLAKVLIAGHGYLSRWFVLLPFGAYAVLFTPVWLWAGALEHRGVNPLEGPMPLYGTLWSDVNGMETPLTVLLFAAVLWLVVRAPVRSRRIGTLLGVGLAMLTLARLDVVFVAVAVPVTLFLSARARQDRRGVRAAGRSAAVLVVIVGVYLVANQLYAGSALPTSGVNKSTFPRPTLGNWRDLSAILGGNHLFATVRLYRHGPMIITGLVALVWLVTATVPRRAGDGQEATAGDRYRLALTATAAGVLVLSLYDWFFVPANEQGHWYWPVSTLFVSLVVLEGIAVAVRWWAERRVGIAPERRRTRPGLAGAATATAALLCLAGFLVLGRRRDYHARFAAFALHAASPERARLVALEGPDVGLLAIDDGIDAWALDLPALSGTGLMLDHRAQRAQDHGELVALALRRGFRVVSSVAYVDGRGLSASSPSWVLASRIAGWLPHQRLSGVRFRVIYRSQPLPDAAGPPAPVVLIKIVRRPR